MYSFFKVSSIGTLCGGMTYRLVNKNAKEYWTVDNPTNKYARIEAQGPEGAKGALSSLL